MRWMRLPDLNVPSMIKEHTTIQARAACDLSADRRTCLTGTPLQNSLNDIFSLVRFLRLEPFTDRGVWTQYIGGLAKVGDPLGVSRLQLVMRQLALRRTKATKTPEGRPILNLPPKKEEITYLDLDEREKAFYTAHHVRYKSNFMKLEETDSLLKNYCSILQELLRLRQICAHMALVRDSEDRGEGNSGDIVTAIEKHGITKDRAIRLLALLRDTGAAQCVECNAELVQPGIGGLMCDGGLAGDEGGSKRGGSAKRGRKPKALGPPRTPAENDDGASTPCPRPVLTRCQHLFCLPCFQRNVCPGFPKKVSAGDRAACSVCKTEISPVIDAAEVDSSELESTLPDDAEEETGSKKPRRRVVEHSTKIRCATVSIPFFWFWF
jgi:SWI/SNF-related matrix-associated actin-dependent regulator of chromatin subfamily A3